MYLWEMINEDSPQEEVEIKGAVNLKASPISDYEVRLAYGDLTLIVAMIRDYIKEFDKAKEEGTLKINPIEYEAYYRGKFLGIADRISEQIEYDYEAHLKKCIKKLEKQSSSDVGGEAMELALKRG